MSTMTLRVPIAEGSDEYIEVEVDRRDLGDSVQLTSGLDADVATAPFTLASSVDRILPALSMMLTKLRSATHAPDEITIGLGLKIGGETGLIFAKGTAEATFTVTCAWQKPDRIGAATHPDSTATA